MVGAGCTGVSVGDLKALHAGVLGVGDTIALSVGDATALRAGVLDGVVEAGLDESSRSFRSWLNLSSGQFLHLVNLLESALRSLEFGSA